MTYIIGDIHGCYKEYRALLEKLRFSRRDTLYVLGDAVDRGPEPMAVLLDMMDRPNVYYILGNHDLWLLSVMGKLAVDITEANLAELDKDFYESYLLWMQDGGVTTAKDFANLSKEMRAAVLEYLQDAPVYETVEHAGKLYILTHAGIAGFDPEKDLEEYPATAFLWERADYDRRYFPGDRIKLVTGHTPTELIRPDGKPLIYEANGHIALDCGCVYGGNLAAWCVETGQVTYVPGSKSPCWDNA